MRRVSSLLAVVALALAGAAPAARVAIRAAAPATVTVMTRNLYLGTSLDPIVKARSLEEGLRAVAAGWNEVQANDFPTRARAIAAEIAAAKPDFVGFQEAVLYRTQTPSDFTIKPARDVALDYVLELRKAFKERGLHYRFVGINPATDAEMPAGAPATMDVRITVRDALAVRITPRVKVLRVRRGLYTATKPLIGGLVIARRGWVSADARVGGRTIRVITTHLESFDRPVQEAQSEELLRRPAATRLPAVLLGDLNSRPDGSTTKSYANMTAGGFRDAWAQAYPGQAGLTCCHGDDLRAIGGPFYERIDYVLVRGGFRALRGRVTGEAAATRAGGLWPSDHGGLWMTLRLPR